jgi:hypothetical protein
LLAQLGPTVSAPVQQQQQQQQQQPAAPPATELLRKDDFIVYGQTKANASDPRLLALRLIVQATGSKLTDFKLDYRALPGWQLSTQPLSGSVLEPGTPIMQVLGLVNANNSPFQLTLTASYKYGAQPLTETGVIKALPPPQ